MKIEHITKLILKFIGGGIVNFPTRFLKWIKVESCDCNGGNDDSGGDSGGDSQDSVALEDFGAFYISVLDDDYPSNYEAEQVLELTDFFEVPNINLLKGLLDLARNNEANSDPSLFFTEYKDDPNNAEGWYNHSITIYPQGGESGNIEVSTSHSYLDDGETRTDTYDIAFYYDSDTGSLTVSYVNNYQG